MERLWSSCNNASGPNNEAIRPDQREMSQTDAMAFGQSAGTPATARQLARLLQLVHEAGHADFRDARGPLGFTQRQAAGKFSRDEAEALIAQLEQQTEEASDHAPSAAVPAARPPKARGVDKLLEGVTTDALAAELQRRGWIVIEP